MLFVALPSAFARATVRPCASSASGPPELIGIPVPFGICARYVVIETLNAIAAATLTESPSPSPSVSPSDVAAFFVLVCPLSFVPPLFALALALPFVSSWSPFSLTFLPLLSSCVVSSSPSAPAALAVALVPFDEVP